MCLGVPGQIVSMDGATAVVDFWGVRRNVALDIVDTEVAVGDHVLVHVGFAIRRIAPEDLAETLAFFESMASEDREQLGPDLRRAPDPSTSERS
jgi:hydrogenase expression/formation protein HypC